MQLCDNDLNSIYTYLCTDFRGYKNNIITEELLVKESGKERVIITICSTGKGAAIKLKDLVEAVTKNITLNNINIIPLGLNNLSESIKEISSKE